MKKTVLLMALVLSMASIHCNAAVQIESKNVVRDLNRFAVTGKADQGEVVGYSLTQKDRDNSDVSELYAVGDIKADANGEFVIIFELSADAPTDTYTFYYGTMKDGIKSLEIEYVNTSNTIKALREASDAEEIKNIFKQDSEHYSVLQYMGFDVELLDSLNNTDAVYDNFYAHCDLTEGTIQDILDGFNRFLGLECINEKKNIGLKYINPVFEGVTYNSISTKSLTTYLNDKICLSRYETMDDFEAAYRLKNILYNFKTASVGSFADLIEKYETDLKLGNQDFYAEYKNMSSADKNSVAAVYLNTTANESINTTDEFGDALKKAVKEAVDQANKPSGGSPSGGVSGGTSSIPAITTNVPANHQDSKAVFTDIETVSWANEAITNLSAKGIINGVGDGLFEPNKNVTREQAVKMMVLSLGINPSLQDVPFHDVKADQWYTLYISEAFHRSIVNGIDNGIFGIGREITRQDLAVIIVRTLKLNETKAAENYEKDIFADEEDISDYAKEAVHILHSKGIINGRDNNCFKPLETSTRAEAAQMIYKAFFREE